MCRKEYEQGRLQEMFYLLIIGKILQYQIVTIFKIGDKRSLKEILL